MLILDENAGSWHQYDDKAKLSGNEQPENKVPSYLLTAVSHKTKNKLTVKIMNV